jgi:hypothetical protein
MTGAILGLPIAFLAGGLLRAVWAMKLRTRCTWRDAIAGLQVWFALSWVVTLACVRGLLRFQTAFLRTPKQKDGEATVLQVVKSAQVELLLAAAGAVAAVAMLASAPSLSTAALSFLLVFQASVYANAPWASASAEGIHLTPLRRAYKRSAQSTGAWPAYGNSLLAVPAAIAAVGLILWLITSLATTEIAPPDVSNPQPPAPVQQASPSPSPSGSPSVSPSPSGSPSPSPLPSPSPSPSATK